MNPFGCQLYKLTIDVIAQPTLKHGARMAGFHIHHHLFVLLVLKHADQGFIQLLGCQLEVNGGLQVERGGHKHNIDP